MEFRSPVAALSALALIVLLAAPAAFAQSPRGTAEGMVGAASVSIDYGRPSLKGRDMLGQAGEGMVWRLGADQATGLTTSADLDFGGVRVPAGSYTLFARKTGSGWTLLVNSQTGQWGTAHDPSMDVAEIPLAVQDGETMEQFTISIAEHQGEAMIHFHWGGTVLMAAVKAG